MYYDYYATKIAQCSPFIAHLNIFLSIPWQRFRTETGYNKHELYCDPEREVYKNLGYAQHNDIGDINGKQGIDFF
jgi:hypothetical protein